MAPFRPASTAPVGYAVNANKVLGKYPRDRRNGWRIEWYQCFNSLDCGFNCCFAHVCYGPCIWNKAMNLIPKIKAEGNADKATASTIFARGAQGFADNSNPNGGGAGAGGALAAGANSVAAYIRGNVRQTLLFELFAYEIVDANGEKHMMLPPGTEGTACSQFLHCCPCTMSCAQVQEVDAVMAYASEHYKQDLYYGDVTKCGCLDLRGEQGQRVIQLPYPLLNSKYKLTVYEPPAGGVGIPLLALGLPGAETMLR